jgi:hypothetical protein
MYNNCPECGSYNPPGTAFCDCGHRLDYEGYQKKRARSRQNELLYSILKRTSIAAVVIGLVLLLFTFSGRSAWPKLSQIQPELYLDPIQDDANLPDPFQVSQKDVVYKIIPRYSYHLSGLVVTQHYSDSLSDVLHEKWNDFLNIKDLCVVWGSNIQSEIYRRLTYSSGNFTCFCKWQDRSIGKKFNFTEFSNNHLLSDDAVIKRRILDTEVGDQISLSGFLCRYENPATGFYRDTSTVRTDSGNHACETIYVTEFHILKRANYFKRVLYRFSWVLFSFGLVLFISLAFLFPKHV